MYSKHRTRILAEWIGTIGGQANMLQQRKIKMVLANIYKNTRYDSNKCLYNL